VDETQNVLVIDKTGDVVPKSELAAWDPSKLTVVFVLGGPGSKCFRKVDTIDVESNSLICRW
jgi:hypothetical protein